MAQSSLSALRVSIPKRVLEALKLELIKSSTQKGFVSIPKRVLEALKLYYRAYRIYQIYEVSIPKRVLEALKL